GLSGERRVDRPGLGVEGGQMAVGLAVGAADAHVAVGRLGTQLQTGVVGVRHLVVVVADQVDPGGRGRHAGGVPVDVTGPGGVGALAARLVGLDDPAGAAGGG